MYNTVSIKNEWRTVFRCGNMSNPEDVILILGSCRVVPYLNYLDYANAVCGNRFKIYAIDPINYQIDSAGNLLDTRGLLKGLESDAGFLAILRETTIFIHEGLSSFGILNTVAPERGDTWEKPVTIYDFGMGPRVDINVPNFHDVFILFNDFIALDKRFQGRELTEEDEREMVRLGDEHIARFCGICERSSFPEFGEWFRENYLERRLFHSFNHVAAGFTVEMFRRMNEQFLKLLLEEAFWGHIGAEDIYANVQTAVTERDRRWRAWKF